MGLVQIILGKMAGNQAEISVIRSYLDTVIGLPWHTFTKDDLNQAHARKVLDHDHYGLEKVKERILEILAVRQLNTEVKGQIICLVGPPGVGKTSLRTANTSRMRSLTFFRP